MKTQVVQIDDAGRVALPKSMREQLKLARGDKLRISVEGNSIRLEPVSFTGKLVREGSVLVFTREPAQPIRAADVDRLIERHRESRVARATRKPGKKAK